jgi:photosynthetic reaction center H subunit
MDRLDDRDERNREMARGHSGEIGRLTHLDDLKDFKVADGEPDIRGWAVKTAEGVRMGKVADLLVDSSAMKVRYMDVALDRKVLDLEDDRHVLVPIGAARLNDDDDVVVVNRQAGELTAMPEYRRGTITPNDERVLYDQYARGTSAAGTTGVAGTDERFYDQDHFDDREFLKGRRGGKDDSEYIVRVKEYVVRDDKKQS